MIPTKPWVTPGIYVSSGELNPPQGQALYFQTIVLQTITERYGVSYKQMAGKDRYAPITHARQLFFYIMRTYYKDELSLKKLGAVLSKDHTTVIHSVDTYENGLKVNDKVSHLVNKQVNGPKFYTVVEDYTYFKTILKQCLEPNTISSASQVESDQEKTPLQNS